MPRPKGVKNKVKEEGVISVPTASLIPKKVEPIMQEFGHGDLNVLRDKINELIKVIA